MERRHLVVLLTLIALQQLDMNVYRFESGYAEVWYQLPVSCLVDSQHLQMTADTFYDFYSFQFHIQNIDGTDSAYFDGRKTIVSCGDRSDELIIDCIPLNLYSGRFEYTLQITTLTGEMQGGGTIEIAPDTGVLSSSDVIIGRSGHGAFVFHDVHFLPFIRTVFTDREELFSYLEIYGLVPDSMFYVVIYRIIDEEGAVVLDEKRDVLKHDYVQIDTHTVDLSQLVDGRYDYGVVVQDPSSKSRVERLASFSVKAVGDYADRDLYAEIHYLVSAKEYDEFLKLTDSQKDAYLKEFWSRHDFVRFQKLVAVADQKFSAGRLLGRDSERGRLYILHGPPDEIETVPIATWSRPFEVWYYYGSNDYLFCDVKNDNNPRLIRILKPGEIVQIIQSGLRDGTREEDWLSDIAPGTHDWHKDLESVE